MSSKQDLPDCAALKIQLKALVSSVLLLKLAGHSPADLAWGENSCNFKNEGHFLPTSELLWQDNSASLQKFAARTALEVC